MTDAPEVSVIIPLYNAEKFIAECLESLLAQTLQDFEIVVVDDCSTDSSRAIVESYVPTFGGRLKLSAMKKNSGCGSLPRNKGLKLSRGEYVFFVDADDLLTPTALEELHAAAKNFSADVVYLERHFEASAALDAIQIAGETFGTPTLETDNLAERVQDLVEGKIFLTTCSKFVRRDFLFEHEIFFPPFAPSEDDVWTCALIFFAERIVRVPNPVYVWRQSENSVLRRERTAQETLTLWMKPIVRGTKLLDEFMGRIEFFRQNVQYRCAVLEFFVHTKTAQVFESSLNLSPPEIFSAIKNEFGESLGEHDVLISWLLADLITQQKIFAQIKNA